MCNVGSLELRARSTKFVDVAVIMLFLEIIFSLKPLKY
jgi:hypothetical protein